uniref:RNA-directed RNA polymerase n=1 Tax=Scaphoideus titanus permutotetra-like virus 1 TaxID=2716555 RepID=A0A6G7NRT1_9VIRU|nr:RNA-directed RNA polymerase [Scaphoideus titanus permutotetra-like virus 1]
MDCSNPVSDGSRRSLRSLYMNAKMLKRQDLNYVQTLAKSVDRYYLPSLPRRERGPEERKQELESVVSSRPILPPGEKANFAQLQNFLKKREQIDLCNWEHDGVAIHPAGVQQKAGKCSTSRVWGHAKVDRDLVNVCLEFLSPDEVKGALASKVYSYGTPQGFLVRLRELCTRKCVSVLKSHVNASGVPMSNQQGLELLARVLPVDLDLLDMDWNRDVVELALETETSNRSTAGFPYCVSKPAAMQAMLESVLPQVCAEISRGTAWDFIQQNPELALVECKNKLDRYEIGKLKDKTRPYFALPFHFQVLFSILCQPFCDALKLFTEEGNNAYGFSWANGGSKKFYDFMVSAGDVTKEEPKYIVYGDDVDIFFRHEGQLYRVSPDFRQMDGSVDKDCVDLVCQYVYETFAKKYGDSDFWKNVCKMWAWFATQSYFLVDGPDPWQKTTKDGILSGVVGTTLFDTAKAAMSYHAYVSVAHRAAKKGDVDFIFSYERSAKWFKDKCGLEVKEGTWTVSGVNEMSDGGQLVAPNKFLGMRLKNVSHLGGDFAPALEYDEWLEMLLVTKDDPSSSPMSNLSRQRLLFDRLRGLYITGGWCDPTFSKVLTSIVNTISETAILMSVQSGGGKGASPEVKWLDTVEYPTSEGFPTFQWAAALYRQGATDVGFRELFPGLSEALSPFRVTCLARKPQTVVIREEIVRGLEQSVVDTMDYDAPPFVVDEVHPIMFKKQPPSQPPKSMALKQVPRPKAPPPRPKVVDFVDAAAERAGLPVRDYVDRARKKGEFVHKGLVSQKPVVNPDDADDIREFAEVVKKRKLNPSQVVLTQAPQDIEIIESPPAKGVYEALGRKEMSHRVQIFLSRNRLRRHIERTNGVFTLFLKGESYTPEGLATGIDPNVNVKVAHFHSAKDKKEATVLSDQFLDALNKQLLEVPNAPPAVRAEVKPLVTDSWEAESRPLGIGILRGIPPFSIFLMGKTFFVTMRLQKLYAIPGSFTWAILRCLGFPLGEDGEILDIRDPHTLKRFMYDALAESLGDVAQMSFMQFVAKIRRSGLVPPDLKDYFENRYDGQATRKWNSKGPARNKGYAGNRRRPEAGPKSRQDAGSRPF